MANKIVRSVTGTTLRGQKIEPFKTNEQNDLLSDAEDAFIRNKK
jgi:hypothetical protein